VVAGGVVYVSSDHGDLYALRASDGARLWSHAILGGASSGLAVGAEIICIGTVSGLYALRA
jgi:outer membrane protein assembly factor BamB